MTDTSWNYLTAVLFGLAIIHTFFTARFERLAHRDTAHQGLWHLFGEVEAVFALWSFVLLTAMVVRSGSEEVIR